jgi:hypothetical protein
MLEIKLLQAMEPDELEEQPCGICGADFEPEAVLANLVTPHEYRPICEVCFNHLARRVEEEAIPADWGDVYRRYLRAVKEHPEPVFPSVEALIEEEDRCPRGYGLAAPEF